MKSDYLAAGIGISLALHATLLTALSMPNSPLKPPVLKKVIEVAYAPMPAAGESLRPIPAPVEEEIDKKKAALPKLPSQDLGQTLFKKKTEKVREEVFRDSEFFKETPQRHARVSTPDIPGEIFETPTYKNYYQIVREKIRRYAFNNYRKLQEGKVLVNFELNSEGQLLSLSIDVAESVENAYLREIAEKSVRDASPFPAFPVKLKDNKIMPFKIIISFEIK